MDTGAPPFVSAYQIDRESTSSANTEWGIWTQKLGKLCLDLKVQIVKVAKVGNLLSGLLRDQIPMLADSV